MKSWDFKVANCGNHQFRFSTNLDLHQAEDMPKIVPFPPRIGDLIESDCQHSEYPRWRLQLKVIGVTIKHNVVEVELHLSDHQLPYDEETNQPTLRAWYKQIYEKVTGKKFI